MVVIRLSMEHAVGTNRKPIPSLGFWLLLRKSFSRVRDPTFE